MNQSAASQTIVASCVFLDLVGFSKLPTTVQVLAKNRFNATLRLCLSELGESHYWVRDLGDGALIICPNSPEHALFIALKAHQEFLLLAVAPGLPALALRIGLNLGVLKSNPDLEGRANYLGDGINATQRVMDFAQPGQILASRAFVDAVAFLHADYATMFLTPQSRQDKHGRTHEVYTVQPRPETLERLGEEVSARELLRPDVQALQPEPAISTPVPVAAITLTEDTVSIIKNWFIPFNALLFTVGFLWTGFQWFGLSRWHAQLLGGTLGVIGSALWLISKQSLFFTQSGTTRGPSQRSMSAIGILLAVIGCLVTASAWLSRVSQELPRNSPVQAQSIGPQAEPGRTAPSGQSPIAIVPMPASLARPAVESATPSATAKVAAPLTRHLSTNRPIAGTAGQASEADRARCTALLNKSALGESISTAEKQELIQSCR